MIENKVKLKLTLKILNLMSKKLTRSMHFNCLFNFHSLVKSSCVAFLINIRKDNKKNKKLFNEVR